MELDGWTVNLPLKVALNETSLSAEILNSLTSKIEWRSIFASERHESHFGFRAEERPELQSMHRAMGATCRVFLEPLVESSCPVVGIHKVSGEASWNGVH